MTDELSPTQALALWGLLARQGRAPAAEVKPKADRDALLTRGFAEADRPSKTVSLTDDGWQWAGTHFDAPLPPAQQPLQDMLTRLGAHLQATNGILADFIGGAPPLPEPVVKAKKPKARAEPKPKAESESKEKAAPKVKAPSKPRAPSAATLRKRIEEAYLRITGGVRAESVRFTKLRAELGDLDRTTVDAGLAAILKKDKTARLGQIDDMKAIDSAEREAAYSPAGEPFHLLWIQ